MSQGNVASSIMGVRYGIVNNQFRFAGVDIAKKFEFKNATYAVEKLCSKVYSDINLSRCKKTIDFAGVVELARKATRVPREFIEALDNIVKKNTPINSDVLCSYKSEIAIDDNPDFTDPAAAARAWAQIYDLHQESLEKIKELKALLGDGETYKIVNAIPWLYDIFSETNKRIPAIIGVYLSRLSLKMGKPVTKCRAFGYSNSQTRTMYHRDVIDAAYENFQSDKSKFSKYRRRYFLDFDFSV